MNLREGDRMSAIARVTEPQGASAGDVPEIEATDADPDGDAPAEDDGADEGIPEDGDTPDA
jgi:hypothetical protein